MVIDKALISDSLLNNEIDAFLLAFSDNLAEFNSYCERYQREEISISDVTRYLSTITVEAESFFGQKGPSMTLAQLQRYGIISQQFDQLTSDLFKVEIQRNKLMVTEAIQNGDYFIVNLGYNSIKSSVFMVYAKSRVKTEQEQALAELQQEQEATQAVIKVLKALERASQFEASQSLNLVPFQKALDIYVHYFQSAEIATIPACNERVFQIFQQYRQNLLTHKTAQNAHALHLHFQTCCDLLAFLVKTTEQADRVQQWRSEVASPVTQLRTTQKKAPAFFYKYLDASLIEQAREEALVQDQELLESEDDDLGDWFVD